MRLGCGVSYGPADIYRLASIGSICVLILERVWIDSSLILYYTHFVRCIWNVKIHRLLVVNKCQNHEKEAEPEESHGCHMTQLYSKDRAVDVFPSLCKRASLCPPTCQGLSYISTVHLHVLSQDTHGLLWPWTTMPAADGTVMV